MSTILLPSSRVRISELNRSTLEAIIFISIRVAVCNFYHDYRPVEYSMRQITDWRQTWTQCTLFELDFA